MGFLHFASRSMLRSWKIAAILVAATVVLGGGPKVQAGVVSIDLTGYTGDNGGATSGSFRFYNGFGGSDSDLLITNGYSSCFGISLSGGAVGVGLTSQGQNPTTPLILGAGESIGSSRTFSEGFADLALQNSWRTHPTFSTNSFFGFKDSLGRFGYIELTWDSTTKIFHLVSAAYESTIGLAIQTPSSAPVPEPGSAAILALLLGGSAIRLVRTKRSARS